MTKIRGADIVTFTEAQEWTRIDYDEVVLVDLIQVAFDLITDSVNEVDEKLKSKKFIRKLKMCILASLTDMYDNRSTTTQKEEKYRFINQAFLLQLKFGSYSEVDL